MTAAFNLYDLDIKKFAQDGAQASGALNLADFARVCEDLPEGTARPLPAVQWQAQGQWRNVLGQSVPYTQSEVMGQPWLHLEIHTQVERRCQRCLQPMVLPVVVDRDYRFVADEASASAQDMRVDLCEVALNGGSHLRLGRRPAALRRRCTQVVALGVVAGVSHQTCLSGLDGAA